MVRIHIREQLCLLILITSLLALMVLAVSTWVQSHHYLQQSREQLLQVTANLKCDQVGQILSLSQQSVQSFTNKAAVQSYVSQYDNGNTSTELRDALANSLQTDTLDHVLSTGVEDSVYLQAAVYARDDGTGGDLITQATGSGARHKFALPYNYTNGTAVYFGDPDAGYPPSLYPNLTYDGDVASYDILTLNASSSILLGPLYLADVNITLFSITVPIVNDTSEGELLGYLTVVLDGRALFDIIDSEVGLGNTGEVAILGPDRPDNMFDQPIVDQPASDIGHLMVQFKLPPYRNRHPKTGSDPLLPFPISQYPLVLAAYTANNSALNNAGALWSTHNEAGYPIAGGYAIVNSPMVDWVVVFGQTTGEVSAPINSLRDTVLACIFSVVGAIILVCWPIAHYAVKPIRALRSATENSILTYETYAPPSLRSDSGTDRSVHSSTSEQEKDGKDLILIPKKRKKSTRPPRKIRAFQIPQRVPDKKHFIYDELTDLTSKFNDMSDELGLQYAKLEDRVKERTGELEKSRNEAQTANESKTLFIANVSHELRTPLNGIIGMCAVAMQEEDVATIRQSLKIIYKSSDLLLHLLNDLLTFSRSSYGQQLSIEEDTFRLVDVGTQIISIFEKQSKDARVGLKVVFLGPNSRYPQTEEEPEDAIVARRDIAGNLRRVQSSALAKGPSDVGPLREIGLRGDKNRILQILMNLVSNSLKFTPANGQIEVRIRCRGMCDMTAPASESSSSTAVPPDAIDAPLVGVPKILFRKASAAPSAQRGSYISSNAPIKGLVFDFEVEDTGAGIPEHLQKEVFKPFVQGDLALSKKHGGTGLGLAICSQLAELMGGHIRLKSTPEIGSTFTLTLPLRYTKEKVPSVSGSLALSARRGSAASASNSIQFETFSDRSAGSRPLKPQAQPPSRSTSHAPHTPDGELERPRLVGYTQPFILDSNSDDEVSKLQGRRSPAFRRTEPANGPRLQMIASRAESGDEPEGSPAPPLPHHHSMPTPEGTPRERIVFAPDLPNHPAESASGAPKEASPGIKAVEAYAPAIAEDPTAVSIPAVRADPAAPVEMVSPPVLAATAAPIGTIGTGASAKYVALSEPAAPADSAPSVRILVAEDNAVNQQVILRLLKLEKVADVTLAEDGQLAVEAVQKTLDDPAAPGYTLIFMDIQMPRMDGIEATKKIREMGFSAPIVALTAFDHESNRKNCEEAGMNAFLPKPIKRTALKKVLADFKPAGIAAAAPVVPETNSEASASTASVEKQK